MFAGIRNGTSRFGGPSDRRRTARLVLPGLFESPPHQVLEVDSGGQGDWYYRASARCHIHCRGYFTDADRVRREDPYDVLGLSYGDGCTLTAIKQAFRTKAKQLHPDIQNNNTSMKAAHQEFQRVLKAYETLTKIHNQLPGLDASKDDEWRTSIYRRGDRIAMERTDVAGVKRVRPVPSPNHPNGIQRRAYVLGHPQRGGIVTTTSRGEYLEQANGPSVNKNIRTSSVGRGQNKWVTRRTVYTPWNKVKHTKTIDPNIAEQAGNLP